MLWALYGKVGGWVGYLLADVGVHHIDVGLIHPMSFLGGVGGEVDGDLLGRGGWVSGRVGGWEREASRGVNGWIGGWMRWRRRRFD